MLRTSQRLRTLVGVFAAISMLAFSTGVASAAPTTNSSAHHHWYVLVGEQSADGAIMGMSYLPGNITIDQGDTITWVANSLEPHTVTFVTTPPACSPFCPAVNTGTFSGQYENSGFMTTGNLGLPIPTYRTFSLTFTKAGKFSYICLVHYPNMGGTVTVHAAGTPYPESQSMYNTAGRIQTAQIVAAGYRLFGQDYGKTSNTLVYAGDTDMASGADIMRFVPSTVVVRVGQSITFENPSMEPHTVTIGTESATCPPTNGPQCDNPPVFGSPFAPAHETYGGGNFNYWLVPNPMMGGQDMGGILTLTFTKAGTYQYHCAYHDFMGMVGTVIVVP